MNGIFGPLYQYGVHTLERYQPRWFLAENVGGLRNANDGQALTRILMNCVRQVTQSPPIYINSRNMVFRRQDIELLS